MKLGCLLAPLLDGLLNLAVKGIALGFTWGYLAGAEVFLDSGYLALGSNARFFWSFDDDKH